MKKTIILSAVMLMLSIGISSATTTKNYVALDSQSTSCLDISVYASGYWLEVTGTIGGGGGSASISSDGRQIYWSAPGQGRITLNGHGSYTSSPTYVPAGCTGFRVEGTTSSGWVGTLYSIRYN